MSQTDLASYPLGLLELLDGVRAPGIGRPKVLAAVTSLP